MGFGGGAFGSVFFGSGSPVALVSAEQVTRNTVRVRLAGARVRNRGDVGDALHDRGWSIAAESDPAAHVPRVVWCDADGFDAVLLRCDAVLDGPGVVYRAIASERIVWAPLPVVARSIPFRTFGAGRVVTDQQTLRSYDLANLPAGAPGPGLEQPMGTLALGADGDYLTDAGVDNLKKRIIRRLTTARGAFAHMPDYGMAYPSKTLFRASMLHDIEADALEQVLREPGVTDATIQIAVPSPGVLLLGARVTANVAAFGVSVSVPLS